MAGLFDSPTLQDLNTPTDERLYSGNKIYCLGAKITYGMSVEIANKPNTMADSSNIDTDTGIDLGL